MNKPLDGQLSLLPDADIIDPELIAALDRRCTPARSGTGPAGETCGTCRHYCRVHYRAKVYRKCGLVRESWTHGRGSDIRAKWAACACWAAQDD